MTLRDSNGFAWSLANDNAFLASNHLRCLWRLVSLLAALLLVERAQILSPLRLALSTIFGIHLMENWRC